MSGILKIAVASAALAAAFVTFTERATVAPKADRIAIEQPADTKPVEETAPRRGVRVISLSPRQA